MIARVFAVFFVATVSLAAAQSQPPAPTTTPDTQNQQSQGEREARPATGVNQSPQGGTPTVDQPPTNRNAAERREQRNEAEDQTPTQWWTLTPAVIGAISAGVSAIFAVLIWLVYKGQWQTMAEQARYMQEGLTETRRAAEAAGVSAEAARVSAGVAVTVAEQADRPWLNVKVHMSAKLAISSAKGAWIEVRLVITNVGHSAAQYTQIIVGAMIDRPNIQGQTEVKRIVDAAPRSTMGEVVLPGDTLEQTFVLGIPIQDIEAKWAASLHLMELPPQERGIDPIVFGCVRYTHGQSTHGPQFPTRWHATTFGYHIARIDPDAPDDGYLPITLGLWEIETLRIIRSPHDFSYAD